MELATYVYLQCTLVGCIIHISLYKYYSEALLASWKYNKKATQKSCMFDVSIQTVIKQDHAVVIIFRCV